MEIIDEIKQCQIIMGNETVVAKTKYRDKNSFSVDFGHQLPSKIKPNANTFKLIPLVQPKQKPQLPVDSSVNDNEGYSQDDTSQVKKINEELKKQSSARLTKLNSTNDQLRRELIRISTQLTEKLKKKKFEVKKVEQMETNPKNKERLKKELENAYKQIDMYKKLLYDLKIGENSGAKLLDVEDKITAVDLEIEKTMVEIQAIKNVTTNQSAGIRKDNDKGSQALEQLKREIEQLKQTLKQKSKRQRTKEKVYMQQHHYMKALQEKLKKIDEEEEEEYDEGGDQPSIRDIKAVEEQLQQLKIKHDQYHKKINSYLTINKALKESKKQLQGKVQKTDKIIHGLKYKRDAYVKQIKDNLHLFATAKQEKQEELSEFQSQDQEEPDPIQQQQEQRGTFDVQHLKDQQLKHIPRENIQKMRSQKQSLKQEVIRSEAKMWKKQLTRIISKGKQMPDQKPFMTGLNSIPTVELKIILMNVWMNKKKQITSIQPSYLIDGRIIEGNKSSRNTEDEYRVTFELEEGDYLKSVLGIFGKSGFLEYLVLQSNYGKISKIGREQSDGDSFAIGVAKEQTPVQITGANRQDAGFWRISRLDFEVLIQTAN